MTTFLRRFGVIIGLAVVIGTAGWLRWGFEPTAGSHRITVEHREAKALEEGVDTSGFVPVEVSVQRPRGTSIWSSDVSANTWTEHGNGTFRSKPGSQDFTYAGQASPITWVTWSSDDGPANIRISVDGTSFQEIESVESGRGTVPIEFGQSLPFSSWLLLAAAIGWSLPISVLVVATLRRLAVGVDRRQLIFRSIGVLGVGFLVVQVWPIDPPAVVRYDLEVRQVVDETTPADVADVMVFVRDTDGLTRLGEPAEIGRVASDDAADGDADAAWRWMFVGSPRDRIEIPATAAPVRIEVVVNGQRTELTTNVGAQVPVARLLAELGPPASWTDDVVLWGSRLGDLALVSIGLAMVAALVSRRPRMVVEAQEYLDEPLPARHRSRLVRAVVRSRFTLGVWATWLVVLWPGMMNPDSAMQWKSLERRQLSDWHPYPMSIVLGVMRYVVDSPWLPIGLLALTAGLLVGLAATWAEDAGLPVWCVRAVAWGPGIVPVTSIMTVALWKDVVMGIGVLALVLVLWRTEQTSGAWLQARRRNLAFAVAACLVIWLTRHNGWPIVVGSLAVVAVLRSKARRGLLVVALVTVAVALVVRIPLKQVLDVEASPVVAHNYMQRISAHVNSGTHLEPDEAAYLAALRPLDIPWPYDCRTVQTTWFGDDVIPWQEYVSDEAKLRNLVVKLAFRNPAVEVAHLKCSTRIVWQITDRGSYTYFLDGYTNAGFANTIPVARGDLPLEAHPSNSLAVSVYDFFVGLPSALIRPALYLYLLLGAAALAAMRRRSLGPILVVTPALIQTVTLLPFGLVQDTRFQYGTVLVAVVMVPLLLAESMRSDAIEPVERPVEAVPSQ